ncbi:hypothetical protein BGZ58_000545 [Dissophora ornata]|nr:hypothetical protein BGZ58_000545 [Dissophora ornata]
MEIEIKIRLPTEEDTAKLEQALGGNPARSEDQDNVFFDGVHKELSGKGPIAVVALKGNAVLIDGIATVEEEEEEIDIDVAKRIIEDPNLIPGAAKSNERRKFEWQEYIVEVDRTTYPHGTAYEVEIESADPEKAKARLTSLLQEHDVAYGNSQRNKFENMLLGTLI